MKKALNRRDFLKASLFTAAGSVLASCTSAATPESTEPTKAILEATATVAPEATATVAPEATSAVAAPEAGVWSPSVPPVPKKFDGVQISSYFPGKSSLTYAKNDTITDNVFSRRQKSNLGLDYTVWSEGGEEAYKADIASNNLPDKWSANQVDLIALVANDQVEDITAMWEQFASPLLKEKKNYPKGKGWVPCRVDGKLYGIAFSYGPKQNIDMLGIIREDFLEKVGLPMPTTLDELEATMKAFLDAGLCTIGLTGTKSLTSWYFGLDPIFGAFETMKGIWQKTADGSLAYSSIDPKIKEPLALLNKWYTAGLLDANLFTNTETEAAAASINSGLFFSAWWNNPKAESGGVSCYDILQKFPEARLTNKMPLPKGPTGKNGRLSYYDTGAMIVFKKGIDPVKVEAFISEMNWCMEMHVNFEKYQQYGELRNGNVWDETSKGYEYEIGADGEFEKGPVFGGTYNYYSEIGAGFPYICYPDYQVEPYTRFAEMQKADPATLLPIQRFGIKYLATDAEAYLQITTDQVPGYYNEFIGVASERMQAADLELNELENTSFAEIISGAKPVDEGFDEFVKNWKAQGGDNATEDVNAWWSKNKS